MDILQYVYTPYWTNTSTVYPLSAWDCHCALASNLAKENKNFWMFRGEFGNRSLIRYGLRQNSNAGVDLAR